MSALELVVIRLNADEAEDNVRLNVVLQTVLGGVGHSSYSDMDALPDLRGKRLLFAVALGAYGINAACARLLRQLRAKAMSLDGCVSALLVDGRSELYTKSVASELALALNGAGSALLGRPLVEATGSLQNFRIQAKNLGTDLMGAYFAAVREMIERLQSETFPRRETPALLALHASNHRTSNTLQLWAQVRKRLGDNCTVEEIGLRNGTVSDCSGCPYTACLHFGESGRCFYGGLMQEEVWPAVRRCDAVVLLCPNYNDALSANLTAFINRMTGLFRQMRFYDKAVFVIVVSGYSGGDIVARQVVDAMNMNKSFFLPPRFALIETANDPGEALMLPGIDVRLDGFAERIRETLCAHTAAESGFRASGKRAFA